MTQIHPSTTSYIHRIITLCARPRAFTLPSLPIQSPFTPVVHKPLVEHRSYVRRTSRGVFVSRLITRVLHPPRESIARRNMNVGVTTRRRWRERRQASGATYHPPPCEVIRGGAAIPLQFAPFVSLRTRRWWTRRRDSIFLTPVSSVHACTPLWL